MHAISAISAEVRAHESREACFPFSSGAFPSKRPLEDARRAVEALSVRIARASKELAAATTPNAKAKAEEDLRKAKNNPALKTAYVDLRAAETAYVAGARVSALKLPDPLSLSSDKAVSDLGAALTYRWLTSTGNPQWSSPECIYWTTYCINVFSPRLALAIFNQLITHVPIDTQTWLAAPWDATTTAPLNRLLLLTCLWDHIEPTLQLTDALIGVFDVVLMVSTQNLDDHDVAERNAHAFRDLILVHNVKPRLPELASQIVRRLAKALVQRTAAAASAKSPDAKAKHEASSEFIRQALSACVFTVLHADLVSYGFPGKHQLPPLVTADADVKAIWDAFKRDDPALAKAVRALVESPLNDSILEVWVPGSASSSAAAVAVAAAANKRALADKARAAIAALALSEKQLTVAHPIPHATSDVVVVPDSVWPDYLSHRQQKKNKNSKLDAYLKNPTYMKLSDFMAQFGRWALFT